MIGESSWQDSVTHQAGMSKKIIYIASFQKTLKLK